MEYAADTLKICDILDTVAMEGMIAPPKVYKWSSLGATYQGVTFTEEQKQIMRNYCAKYMKVLRQIDYPFDSFSGERQRTASLLQMLIHGMDPDSSAEYACSNSQRLSNALISHKGVFEALEFESAMKTMMAGE